MKNGWSVTMLAAGAMVFSSALAVASSPDEAFMKKAAQGGQAEVELGQLAKDKGANDSVKSFGQRMVDDHSKANDELKNLASQKNVTLPTALSAKDQALKDRLEKLNGRAFDRAYIQAMVKDHREDVVEFQKESTSGADTEVKAWASKTLPTLREHLHMAERDEKGGGKTTAMK